jgi:hypothetical protein
MVKRMPFFNFFCLLVLSPLLVRVCCPQQFVGLNCQDGLSIILLKYANDKPFTYGA